MFDLFQQFQLEGVGAGDMETVGASGSSDELSSKTNGSALPPIDDPSLTAEEGLR